MRTNTAIKLGSKTTAHVFFLIMNIILFLFSTICFIGAFGKINNLIVTFFSVIAVIISTVLVSLNFKRLLGVSTAVLGYTMATQFPLGIIYFLLGKEYLNNYSSWTLRFLEFDTYSLAVLLAIIATTVFSIANWLGSYTGNNSHIQNKEDQVNDTENRNTVVYIGYFLLILSLAYFLILLVFGRIQISMTYIDYLSNRIGDTPFYSWVIVLYAAGISYIVAAGNKKQIIIGAILYSLTAIILLLTGNKGEVFYAVLACFGIAGYRKFKINGKLLILIFAILFLVIPFISSTRLTGVINSFSSISLNFTDAFTEMGMQIRVSTYLLNEFMMGDRDYIYGFSYASPMINLWSNIIPIIKDIEKPVYFNFNASFPTMGFSQIAESYANFGLLGVFLFYGILGYLLGYVESKKLSVEQTALFASIVVILINMTRNDFAFVPGQILVMVALYLITKKLNAGQKNKKIPSTRYLKINISK